MFACPGSLKDTARSVVAVAEDKAVVAGDDELFLRAICTHTRLEAENIVHVHWEVEVGATAGWLLPQKGMRS